jgi:hypothetical protein
MSTVSNFRVSELPVSLDFSSWGKCGYKLGFLLRMLQLLKNCSCPEVQIKCVDCVDAHCSSLHLQHHLKPHVLKTWSSVLYHWKMMENFKWQSWVGGFRWCALGLWEFRLFLSFVCVHLWGELWGKQLHYVLLQPWTIMNLFCFLSRLSQVFC